MTITMLIVAHCENNVNIVEKVFLKKYFAKVFVISKYSRISLFASPKISGYCRLCGWH